MTSKQQKLLITGRELFWKYGFKRVTVEELCQKAGVSKMTFYRYYNDKLALAKSVFEVEATKGIHDFERLMESDLSPEEKIQGMLNQKSDAVESISKEFLLDFYQSDDDDLKQFISRKIAEAEETILKLFRQAQKRGEFRDDFKPEFMIYISQKMIETLTDPYLLELCGSPQEVIMEFTRFFSYGISKRP